MKLIIDNIDLIIVVIIFGLSVWYLADQWE